MNKVLIIDDDKELCALMKKCIEQENLSAVTVRFNLSITISFNDMLSMSTVKGFKVVYRRIRELTRAVSSLIPNGFVK